MRYFNHFAGRNSCHVIGSCLVYFSFSLIRLYMNWRKFQRHLKSTFAIILVNHLLLVANLMMIVFSCKKELKEHLTIPKENKSKSFFLNGIVSTDAHLSAKKTANLDFFFCVHLSHLFSDGKFRSWSSTELNGKMMDCTNARLATKADNSSNLVTFRYVEIVCTFCGQNLIAFDDGIM